MVKKIWWAVLLMAGCFLGTACTSKEDGNQASPEKLLKPVSLQLQWVTQAQFAGYYVALTKGWYREEGIDLSIKPGGPDIVPVDVVASGTADFGTTLLSDLAAAIEGNSPVISIAQIQQKNGLLLIARKSSGIKGPRDFVGKHVGVWLGSWEAQFKALLAREKVPATDVKVMSQGWSMKPFLKGELDVASAMIYNEYQMVLASGVDHNDLVVIDYADFDLGFPGDVLFTSKQMTATHPELCASMVRVSLRGWEYAMDHPAEAVDILLQYDASGIQTREHQLAMMREITQLIRVAGRQMGYVDGGTLVRMVKLLKKYRILKTELHPERIYTHAFIGNK